MTKEKCFHKYNQMSVSRSKIRKPPIVLSLGSCLLPAPETTLFQELDDKVIK